ncbi:hypothetical protein AB0B89_36220, partial [Sphaerisporangium sp. NPDC049002]|uniref:hypothetical protein n=1 Tax=Sphaerisporangium sp. NPDC049002 TaxID=3155392 RepID=UPI0033C146C8
DRLAREVPDYKRWWELINEALGDYLQWPPEMRGSFADWVARVPVPLRTDTWTEVKPIRAHKQLKLIEQREAAQPVPA